MGYFSWGRGYNLRVLGLEWWLRLSLAGLRIILLQEKLGLAGPMCLRFRPFNRGYSGFLPGVGRRRRRSGDRTPWSSRLCLRFDCSNSFTYLHYYCLSYYFILLAYLLCSLCYISLRLNFNWCIIVKISLSPYSPPAPLGWFQLVSEPSALLSGLIT